MGDDQGLDQKVSARHSEMHAATWVLENGETEDQFSVECITVVSVILVI